MEHITAQQVYEALNEKHTPGADRDYEMARVANTKECAYDGFHQEIHVGDMVVFAASRWTGDYLMYKGIVQGWSDKTIRILAIDGATNSDKPAGMEYNPVCGKTQSRKCDKVYRIWSSRGLNPGQ